MEMFLKKFKSFIDNLRNVNVRELEESLMNSFE